jgi:TatD DNase family protein
MLDSHFHLDRFPQPENLASEAASRGVFVIGVTNLPSHFEAGCVHARHLKRFRLAVGLHPLAKCDWQREIEVMENALRKTSFVGEIGLDFSRHGKSTAKIQMERFRAVLTRVRGRRKFITLHSRGAEETVLEMLAEFGVSNAVFHWYTGSLRTLDRILEAGHFLSANPAMVDTEKGQAVIGRVPQDRLLTETDGPHVLVDGRPALPWHVGLVEDFVGRLWGRSPREVRSQVWRNFKTIADTISAADAAL